MQLDESLKNKENYDYEDFSFNNSNIIESNCFNDDKKMKNANELLFIFNNKITFDLDSLKKSNILIEVDEEKKIIEPLSINLGFFYYIDILPKYQNEYKFIISEKRKIFISNIIDFANNTFNKYYYMTGAKAIGKTATLLYFSSLNLYNKFYFNFKSIFKQSKKNTKKMMKYELMRLFEMSYEKNDIKIKKIENLIENFDFSKIQMFLESIIYISSDFFNYEYPVTILFILDQYNNNINNFDLDDFKKNINSYKTKNNIKIIISSSLNNAFTKIGIKNSMDYNQKNEFKMHYYSNFFDFSQIIANQNKYNNNSINNSNIIKYGGINNFNYYLKKNNTLLDISFDEIKKDILNDINNEISILIELVILIRYNHIISSRELKDKITKIPLKYISIYSKTLSFNMQNNKYEFYNNNNKKIDISKTNEKLLNYYIINEDCKLTDIIKNNFQFDEFSDEILEKEIKPKKNLGKKIYTKYYMNYEKNQINLIKKELKDITIYKFDYLFPYIEIIFLNIIYDFIKANNIFLEELINYSTEGGLFELLIIYYIISQQKFFDYNIMNFISLRTIVPNNYSLKMYSYKEKLRLFNSKKKDKLIYDINKIIVKNKEKLIDLDIPDDEGIFINQKIFNGKYYDFGILLPNNNKNHGKGNKKKSFILILFQISINKDKIKWLTVQEHEINFHFIKKHIESIYNIEIVNGYFYYILKAENNRIIDVKTYNKFGKRCLIFDINNGFISNNFYLDDNTLITNDFFVFNEASLLKNIENEKANQNIKDLIFKKPEDLDDNIFLLIKDVK